MTGLRKVKWDGYVTGVEKIKLYTVPVPESHNLRSSICKRIVLLLDFKLSPCFDCSFFPFG